MEEELYKIVNKLESIGKRVDRNIIIKDDIDDLAESLERNRL